MRRNRQPDDHRDEGKRDRHRAKQGEFVQRRPEANRKERKASSVVMEVSEDAGPTVVSASTMLASGIAGLAALFCCHRKYSMMPSA